MLLAVGLGQRHLGDLFADEAVGAGTPAASSSPVQVTFSFQGRPRSYWLYRPTQLRAGAPMLVVLPGDGFPTPGVPDYELLADQQRILLSFPLTESKWDDPSDPAFVGAVVDDVIGKQGADRDRVYLMGGSAGGYATYRMACGPIGARFAGAGAIFGSLTIPNEGQAGIRAACNPVHPLTIAGIHGTADTFVPYTGLPCRTSHETGKPVCLPSQPDLMRFWAGADGCPAEARSSTEGVLRTDAWQPCRKGTAVALFTVAGAGHSLEAVTVGGVSPMARLWSFFASHFPAAAAPLQARILSAKPVRPAPKQPTLVVRVSVNKQVTARLRLTRGKSLAASTASTWSAGTRSARLQVRPSAVERELFPDGRPSGRGR